MEEIELEKQHAERILAGCCFVQLQVHVFEVFWMVSDSDGGSTRCIWHTSSIFYGWTWVGRWWVPGVQDVVATGHWCGMSRDGAAGFSVYPTRIGTVCAVTVPEDVRASCSEEVRPQQQHTPTPKLRFLLQVIQDQEDCESHRISSSGLS